jgi:hypothetical protein
VRSALEAYEIALYAVAALFAIPVMRAVDVGSNKMALDDHVRIGRILQKLDRALSPMYLLHQSCLSAAHGTCVALKALDKTGDTLRCVLDDAVCDEHPSAPDAVVLRCYYGFDYAERRVVS